MNGKQVSAGNYGVLVLYNLPDTGGIQTQMQPTVKASFAIAATITPPNGGKGSVTISPTSGTVPYTASLVCTGDTIANLLVEWGDGQSTENVTCPTTLNHTYTSAGDYTITIKQAGTVLFTQKVTATVAAVAPTTDGKSAPSKLASSGANLLLILLIAAVLSGVVSYFIIRRPFHGDE